MRNVATVGFALGMAWLGTGCTLDMNVGDLLKPRPGGGGHSGGSGGGGGSSTGSAGEDGGTPECLDTKQGSESSCKDVATWKQYASDDCQSRGLQLSDYLPQVECGKDLYRYVGYTCCPVEPPVPVPEPGICIDAKLGYESSCKDVATWKQYASDDCQSRGLQLSDYLTQEECGKDLYRYVSYSCCPVEPPVPTPSTCTDAKQGSESSCKDVFTWKQDARADCESRGLQLGDYLTQEECGEGLYRYVSYACCSG